MTSTSRGWAAELLAVWFEELTPGDWFGSSDSIDHMLRERFERVLLSEREQPAAHFLIDAKTARAAILLFDQVPRNIYRGTAEAFAFDRLALDISNQAIAKGWDTVLSDAERRFVAMPLMHSEDLSDQEASVAYFEKHFSGDQSFARSHHEMIAKFGRFPHRNAALGRETTEAEQRAIDDGFSW